MPLRWLFIQIQEAGDQSPSAAAHGGAACPRQVIEQWKRPQAQRVIALGEVSEGLHGECLHDPAVVVQVFEYPRNHAARLCRRERQPWQHLGQMPPHFLLGRSRRQSEERGFVRLKPVGVRSRHLFGCIRAPHADQGIGAVETAYHRCEQRGSFQDFAHDAVRLPDRPAISTGELAEQVVHGFHP